MAAALVGFRATTFYFTLTRLKSVIQMIATVMVLANKIKNYKMYYIGRGVGMNINNISSLILGSYLGL